MIRVTKPEGIGVVDKVVNRDRRGKGTLEMNVSLRPYECAILGFTPSGGRKSHAFISIWLVSAGVIYLQFERL